MGEVDQICAKGPELNTEGAVSGRGPCEVFTRSSAKCKLSLTAVP